MLYLSTVVWVLLRKNIETCLKRAFILPGLMQIQKRKSMSYTAFSIVFLCLLSSQGTLTMFVGVVTHRYQHHAIQCCVVLIMECHNFHKHRVLWLPTQSLLSTLIDWFPWPDLFNTRQYSWDQTSFFLLCSFFAIFLVYAHSDEQRLCFEEARN